MPSKRTRDGAPLLSVVVIALNEAQNLPRLLRAVGEWADEILVFDSGSTDGTVELAKEAGAHVVNCPWEGWSTTKNKANAAARGEWILSLDADEAPDAACAAAIRQHIQGGVKTTEGSWRVGEVNRMTNYCGQWVRHSGWFPDRNIRLWPRGAAQWAGAIHETPEFQEPTTKTRLPGVVEHYSYPHRADHLSQIEKFGRVWAEDQFASGKSTPLALVGLKVVAQWVKTFCIKRGFLDGHTGW
ncbi:MAG: glycosyltransferase family 2 protein, partial [Flavobacteriales bacterium]|nr:glycosyltransferase family 2 protein [Flavobacteriales bacterium]